MALEAASNVSLVLPSREQLSLSRMGCWIYTQLSLSRPADRKLNIAQVWPNSPQWVFNGPAAWTQTSTPFLNTFNQVVLQH